MFWMGGQGDEVGHQGGMRLFGGWLRRTLSHRWKKGWKRNQAFSKKEVEGQKQDGEKGKKELEEEEDTRSENDSAYESLPGSARGVCGDTSRELSQSPSWEKQKTSWDSLSSSGSGSRGGGKWGAAPTSIIKPGGEGIVGGGRQPKKKVSFPERDLKMSEGGVERKREDERKVKGGVRSEKREGCVNGWVRREGREGWVRIGELEIESKREQEGVRRRRALGGDRVKGAEGREVAATRFQGTPGVPPRYLVPREVTRYRGGSQSVASQVEAIRGETRAWLRSTFPR